MNLSRSQRIALFVAIAFVGSWSLLLAFYFWGGVWDAASRRAIGILYLCPPALAALTVQGPVLKGPVLAPLGLRFGLTRGYMLAWTAPIVVLLLGAVLLAWWPGLRFAWTFEAFLDFQRDMIPAEHFEEYATTVRNQPIHPVFRIVIQALAMGLSFNLIVSVSEELGFRGFLYEQFGGSFTRRTFSVAAVWAFWLTPLAAAGQFHGEPGIGGVLLIWAWAFSVSPLLTYIREKTGSVVAVAMFRGTFSALTLVPLSLTDGGPIAVASMHGGFGIVGSLALFGALVLYDRRRLRSSPPKTV